MTTTALTILRFRVYGAPAPQGSKRHVGNGVMIESSKKVKPWREAVKWAALQAHPHSSGVVFPTGPLLVGVTFHLARPKAHYYTGKRAAELRDAAPLYVPRKPDIDKLLRATFDALTDAGIWTDDSQAAAVNCRKVFSTNPGAVITIHTLNDRNSA